MATQTTTEDHKSWKVRFFSIWGGQALSLIGSQLVQFALIWWLTTETGSATVLTTATLVGLLPSVVLGPFVGALVDRWSRKRIMLLADAMIALVTGILAYLYAIGLVQVWTIYLALFFRSLGTGFHRPAMSSSTSLMVPKKHLTRVQGANQTLQGGLNIISAPLGALLLEVLSMSGILSIDVLSAVFAIIPLLFTAIPQPKTQPSQSSGGLLPMVWDDFKIGLRYVGNWPGLLGILIMALVINMIVTPAFSLLPLLVKNHFGGSALELGWVESAFGIGTILGGVVLSAWGGFRKRIVTSLAGSIFSSLGFFLIATAPSSLLVLAISGTFIIGIFLTMVNGPIFAILQATVDPGMQGRVFTLVDSGASAMSPLGLIIAGPVAEFAGVQTWFLASGFIMLTFGIIGFFIPAILNIERNSKKNTTEQSQEPSS